MEECRDLTLFPKGDIVRGKLEGEKNKPAGAFSTLCKMLEGATKDMRLITGVKSFILLVKADMLKPVSPITDLWTVPEKLSFGTMK